MQRGLASLSTPYGQAIPLRTHTQAGMGLVGLWLGMTSGDFVALCMCLIAWLRVDWPAECKLVAERCNTGDC